MKVSSNGSCSVSRLNPVGKISSIQGSTFASSETYICPGVQEKHEQSQPNKEYHPLNQHKPHDKGAQIRIFRFLLDFLGGRRGCSISMIPAVFTLKVPGKKSKVGLLVVQRFLPRQRYLDFIVPKSWVLFGQRLQQQQPPPPGRTRVKRRYYTVGW